jgi:hypothetical protein
MNDTLTMTRPPGRIRRSDATAIAVAVVLFALLVLLAAPALDSPATAARLDVENRTPWPVTLGVRSASGAWIPVGIASARTGTAFTETPDPGQRWQLRWSYGDQAAISTLRRSEVEANGWSVSVPDELVEALDAAGTPPAPPRGT